jgi:hypothetical protein
MTDKQIPLCFVKASRVKGSSTQQCPNMPIAPCRSAVECDSECVCLGRVGMSVKPYFLQFGANLASRPCMPHHN